MHFCVCCRDQYLYFVQDPQVKVWHCPIESSLLWRSLTEEEREKYNEDAKRKHGNLKEVNVKKECKKIVSHLQEMVYRFCTFRICELFVNHVYTYM